MSGIEMEIIDQCVVNNGDCDHYCQTTLTGDVISIGVVCSCHHGYRLHLDGRSCIGMLAPPSLYVSDVFKG